MKNCESEKFDEIYHKLKLGHVSLFAALAGAQLDQIWPYLECRRYAAGQKIFQQGDLPAEIYVVISGKVDFVVEKNGVLEIHACYEAGQSFGESAYLGIQPHAGCAQVRSVSNAEILVLTRDALMNLQKFDLETFSIILMNLSREVSRKYYALIESAS